ncbi:UNVERIFIED_CONTAM: hypothetical protein Sangu_3114000 [Sesamum angustifolium]|uniref:Uncharacterized protein n=1 Tax=Sesamum angustifolium TaxID=2727405 RepID=A0AAW2K6I4_9LAMI
MELLGQAPESPPVALFPLVDTLHSRVETLQKVVGEWPDMLDKRVTSAIEEASILTDAVDVRVDGVQAEVNLLKRVVGRDEDRAPMSKVKVPYPKPFSDKLFNFLSRLQTWAQTELRRQGVKDLPTVIAAADWLVDFRVANSSDLEKKKKDSGKEKGKSGKGWKDGKFKKKKHQEVTG